MYGVHIEKQKVYIPRTVKTIPGNSKQLFAVQFIRFIYMNFSVKAIIYFEIKCCSSLNMIKLCSTKTSNE